MTRTAFVNPKQIEKARLAANMTHADLAFAIRSVTAGQLRATEQSIRRWINGKHKPSDGVIPAIAEATGQSLEFFYMADSDDEEDDASLRRELQQLPVDLRRRIERALERKAVQA